MCVLCGICKEAPPKLVSPKRFDANGNPIFFNESHVQYLSDINLKLKRKEGIKNISKFRRLRQTQNRCKPDIVRSNAMNFTFYLTKLPFSSEIQHEINRLYNHVKKVWTVQRRNELLCACCRIVLIKNDIPYIVPDLLRWFNISKKRYGKSINRNTQRIFQNSEYSYKLRNNVKTLLYVINRFYGDHFQVKEKRIAVEIIESKMVRYSSLLGYIAGIIYYVSKNYIGKRNGRRLTQQSIADSLEIDDVTLRTYNKKLKKAIQRYKKKKGKK